MAFLYPRACWLVNVAEKELEVPQRTAFWHPDVFQPHSPPKAWTPSTFPRCHGRGKALQEAQVRSAEDSWVSTIYFPFYDRAEQYKHKPKIIWIGVGFTGLRPNAQKTFKLDSVGLVSLFLLLPRCYLRVRSHANCSETCYRPSTAFLGRACGHKVTLHFSL